jgi:protein-S-isoprenylcysteine O-methyltransferase Ste14
MKRSILMKSRKVLPPTYLFIALMVMVILHFLVPVMKIIPSPWNMFGVIFFLAGIAINLAADKLLRIQGTTVKPFEKSSALVIHGVYRLSRNPMYLGFVSLMAGVAILFGSLTPFLIIPFFMVMVDQVFIKTEENLLAQQFGQAWQDYRKEVRRWL